MTLENAISIVCMVLSIILPQCIKINGKPIKIPIRFALSICAISVILVVSSGIAGFPFDLRNHQSSLPTSSQKPDSQDISGQPSDDVISESPEIETGLPIEHVEIGMPFVESLSDNQSTGVSLNNWDEENDRDIVGNTYHDYAVKFLASDMLNSILGQGESDFNANVHIPFGGKAVGTWYLRVFAAKDMAGNGSSAEVTILADDKEIYSAFSLTSSTTDELRFPIELDDVRDVILHFKGKAIGTGYCAGIVIEGATRS